MSQHKIAFFWLQVHFKPPPIMPPPKEKTLKHEPVMNYRLCYLLWLYDASTVAAHLSWLHLRANMMRTVPRPAASRHTHQPDQYQMDDPCFIIAVSQSFATFWHHTLSLYLLIVFTLCCQSLVAVAALQPGSWSFYTNQENRVLVKSGEEPSSKHVGDRCDK